MSEQVNRLKVDSFFEDKKIRFRKELQVQEDKEKNMLLQIQKELENKAITYENVIELTRKAYRKAKRKIRKFI